MEARGAKMLISCEARAFGVPHPLQRGWAENYGDIELSMAQLRQVFEASEDGRPARSE